MGDELEELLLMRLRDCGVSSKLGMADQGFPTDLRKLAALGLVERSGEGFKITKMGINKLDEQREVLKRI